MTPDEQEAGLLDWFWPEWHAAPHGMPRGARADHCYVCLSGERSLTRHHIIPVHNGGSDSLRNLVTICDFCHSEVHGRPLPNIPVVVTTKPFIRLGEVGEQTDVRQWLDAFRRRLNAERKEGRG
jgi:hypothetical protein